MKKAYCFSLLFVAVIVALAVIAGGVIMMAMGFRRNGKYQVVGVVQKQDGYVIQGNKITPNYKEEAVFDDDYMNFGMGIGGIFVMIAGIVGTVFAVKGVRTMWVDATPEERKLMLYGPILSHFIKNKKK